MNRYMSKLMAGAVLAGGILAAGCHHGSEGYSGHGDPCWPDRYSNESRAAVIANFQPQVENGHILDQTVWNMHFDYGTDRLNGAGQDKLDQLARRRPHPDPKVYVQTARDIPYDPAKPDDYAGKRTDLDSKRVAAVQKYLATTLTGRPAPFDVQVHDPAPPGIETNPGVGPRVYVPSPQERAKGAGVPPIGVSGTGAAPAVGPAPQGQGPVHVQAYDRARPGEGGSSGSSGSSGTRP